MILPLIVAAWCGHTPESRAAAEDFIRTYETLQMKQEECARLMGLDPKDLSKQIAGVKPLNFWRMRQLPPAFQIQYAKYALGRLGAVVLSPDERAFVLGAATLGVKEMARMVPDLIHERRRA